MRFDTEEERLAHPQARLIPRYFFEQVFEGSLSEAHMALISSPLTELTTRIADLPTPSTQERARYWYCIILGHLSASDDELMHLAHYLTIPSDLLIRSAALTGRLDLINRLMAEHAPDDLLSVFSYAALGGHLAVMERLIKLVPVEDRLNLVRWNYDFAFNQAAAAGHLAVMERLIALIPTEEALKMIKSNMYGPFCNAAAGGHLHVMEKLIERAPDDRLDMVKADRYSAFRTAAENGHLHVMEKLIELAPDERLNMITASNYYSFRIAAQKGQLAIMEKLIALAPPEELLNMLKANNYEAFKVAALGGHLSIMEKLTTLVPAETLNMVRANLGTLVGELTHKGNLAVIDKLFALAPPAEMLSLIRANDYTFFTKAAVFGHLFVMERLIAFAPDDRLIMIKSGEYAAFQAAAGHGHLPVMERLIALEPTEMLNMVRSNNYAAFQEAISGGHLAVMERLIALVPSDEVPAMVLSSINAAFLQAVLRHHLPVVNRLLSFSPIMAYAEMHNREYYDVTHPFMTNKLTALRNQRLAIETANPHAVFDITDAEEAKCCFYIIKNLIRRCDVSVLDNIRFLLEIPAVKALAHVALSVGQPNELVRFALSIGNPNAAEILLSIPAVRVLAAHNNYYREESRCEQDLAALAMDRESSMHALTTGEQQRLAAAIERYQPIMREGCVEHLFANFLEKLEERYAENPAKITKDNGQVLALPVEWGAFTALSLNDAERERALHVYYQHKDHTALRYLSRPNHWMHPDASYVYINDAHTERWSTFEEYKSLIVMFWLAAQDTTAPAIDGYTIESRTNHFIEELAQIARAHNWDEQRLKTDGHGYEEYDNLTGDRPSCFSGVKRRLFQSVLGHALLKILREEDVTQELRDFIRTKFSAHVTDKNRSALREVWTKLVNLDTEDAEPLRVINITPAEQTEFKDYMRTKYGIQFNNEPAFTDLMLQCWPEGAIHAQSCDGLVNLGELLAPSPPTVSVAASPDGLFSAPANAGAGAPTVESTTMPGQRGAS